MWHAHLPTNTSPPPPPLATSLFQWVNNCCLPKDMSGRSDSCSLYDSDSNLDSDSDSDSASDSQVVVQVSTRHLTSNDVQKRSRAAGRRRSWRNAQPASGFICFPLIFIASNLAMTTNRSFLMDSHLLSRQRDRGIVGQKTRRHEDIAHAHTHIAETQWGHVQLPLAFILPVIHSLEFVVERRD